MAVEVERSVLLIGLHGHLTAWKRAASCRRIVERRIELWSRHRLVLIRVRKQNDACLVLLADVFEVVQPGQVLGVVVPAGLR